MLLISENEYAIMQVLMWLGIFFFFVTMVFARNTLITRIKEKLGRGKVVLKQDLDGIVRHYNQKIEMGYFKDKDEHTQVAANCIVKTDDGDIYLQTQGVGLSYDLDVATASAYLQKMGLISLKDALIKFDDMYFDKEKHPENYQLLQDAMKKDGFKGSEYEALETIRRPIIGETRTKNIEIKRVLENARKDLIRMDINWINEWTIPLSILYRHGLQNQGSMNNKNIFDKGVLTAKKENIQQGWSQEKTAAMIQSAILIMVGGAVAFAILWSTGALNQTGTTIINTATTTTTTILTTTTLIP